MRWLRFLAMAGLTAVAATGGSVATRPPVFADLADRARSLPPEFAADALLRIADAPATANEVAWKREALEDAFRLAGSAQQPYARRNWTGKPGSLFDKAYAQGLDACTLQCKVVHAMLAIDYKKARELFEEIPAPQIPRLTCDDALVYDPSIYYATVVDVAARAFTAKEVAQDEPFRLLQRYAGALSSPVQVQPIARMLAGARLKPPQLEALAATLAGAIGQLSSDDRSFSAAVASGTDAALAALPIAADAWRGFAARQLKATRCGDSAAQVAALDLSGGDAKPASVEGNAQPLVKCDSLECSHLARQFSTLVVGPNGYGLTPEQKSTSEWGAKLREYLAALADWTQDDDPVEYFQYKSRFYSELFYLAPNGPERDMLLTTLLMWLQLNEYRHDHRVEWFYSVNALIIQAFADPAGMQTTVRELHRSVDPVIAFYAQLEQLLPRPTQGTIGLL